MTPRPPGPRASASPPSDSLDPRATRDPASPNGHPPAEGSGTASWAADVSDPGPAFDPRQAPEAPELEDELPALQELWTEEQIRGFLTLQGSVTHAVLKVSPEDTDTWKQTEEDLASIAPPLTRILNRYDVTRAAAAAGDEILLGTALFSYGAKNYTRRRVLIARRDAAEPQPITGTPAPENTGPEHDESWQRVHMEPPSLTPKGKR